MAYSCVLCPVKRAPSDDDLAGVQFVTTFQSFKTLVLDELLPAFCDDPSRGWGREGFKEDWGNIAERDTSALAGTERAACDCEAAWAYA